MYMTTLNREQLKRIIAHVEFASKDTTLEVLNSVQINAEGSTLTVSSTDRYILGESTLETDSTNGETASVIIPAGDVTAWKQLAKTSHIFQLTLESDGWTLDAFNSKVSGRLINADYPAVGKLFPEVRELHPITPTGLSVTNLDKLGKFTRTAGIPTAERYWRVGQARPDGKGTSPVIALIEGTRVLVMPITGYGETAPEGYQTA